MAVDRAPEIDFRDEKHGYDSHRSTIDSEAGMSNKLQYIEANSRYIAHAMWKNRHGLIVDVGTIRGTAKAKGEPGNG